MASVVSFIIIILLSILITRIASVALAMTGLSMEMAAFQARSAFTGVGFTTSEAESVVKHPVRRKIVMLLMLLGNAGIVSAISSLVITYTKQNKTWYSDIVSSASIILAIIIFWLIFRSKYVKKVLDNIISFYLRKYMNLRVIDYDQFLNRGLDYDIDEILVDEDDWLAWKKLGQVALKAEGIMVIGIERSDGTYLGVPDGHVVIKVGDTLKVYGRNEAIKKLKARTIEKGDEEHLEAIEEEEMIKDQVQGD